MNTKNIYSTFEKILLFTFCSNNISLIKNINNSLKIITNNSILII